MRLQQLKRLARSCTIRAHVLTELINISEPQKGGRTLRVSNQRVFDIWPLLVCFRVKNEEEEGEFRPLVLKTDRESVLRGEDYWIDYSEVIAVNSGRMCTFRIAARLKKCVLAVNRLQCWFPS